MTGELFPIEHAPIRPPRRDVVGEVVYSQAWQLLVDDICLEGILSDMRGEITQRRASVAASLVAWLGTNCGRAFVESAKRFPAINPSKAFLAAWALENARYSWLSGGVRTLEAILAEPAQKRAYQASAYGVDDHELPNLSADDYEVAEHVVQWLGSDDGRRFIVDCEQETKERIEARDLKRRLEAMRGPEEPSVDRFEALNREWVSIPAERFQQLMHQLRTLRAELSDQSRFIAGIVGELMDRDEPERDKRENPPFISTGHGA